MGRVKAFLSDEGGAVSADWVVLSAGIITFAIFVILVITNNTVIMGPILSDTIEAQVTSGG